MEHLNAVKDTFQNIEALNDAELARFLRSLAGTAANTNRILDQSLEIPEMIANSKYAWETLFI